MASMEMKVQKMSATVLLSTDSGVHSIQFDCPRKGDSVEDAAGALSKYFLLTMGKALGAVDRTAEIADLNAKVLSLQAELETVKAAPRPEAPTAQPPLSMSGRVKRRHGNDE